jgi:hypothetical protein
MISKTQNDIIILSDAEELGLNGAGFVCNPASMG